MEIKKQKYFPWPGIGLFLRGRNPGLLTQESSDPSHPSHMRLSRDLTLRRRHPWWNENSKSSSMGASGNGVPPQQPKPSARPWVQRWGAIGVSCVLDLISLIWVPLRSSYITPLLGFFLVAGVDLLLIDPFLVLVLFLFLDLLCSLNSSEEKA
jgi:hypothetical protein